MGDRISTVNAIFFIAAADKPAATEAVKTACRGLWKNSDGMDLIETTTSFGEALAVMRWYVKEDLTTGDVVGVYFEKKPYGDNEVAMAIAPFVREGSMIEVADNDFGFFRWKFTGGSVVWQVGRVVYDE